MARNQKNSQSRNNTTTASTLANTTKQAYEAKVAAESLVRAGRNPQLHGIVHEVLIKDGINLNPINAAKGVRATLTKNPTAKTVDIVVSQHGKIISRIQAKDTAQSLHKAARQIGSGQYNSARVLGTRETASGITKILQKQGIGKTVHSSGVSSVTTKSIAAKVGVTGTSGLSNACMAAAKSNALTGAAAGTAFAVIGGIVDLANDEKDLGEVVCDVALEATGCAVSGAGAGAVSAAAGTAVATGVAALGITGTAAVGLTVGLPLAIGVGAFALCKSIFDSIFD